MKTINNLMNSYRTSFSDSVTSFLPSTVLVPFNRLADKKYKCVISMGDIVREGQIIAVPLDDASLDESAVNAPLPGYAEEIVTCPLPDGRMGQALKIKVGGSFSYSGKKLVEQDWKMQSDDEILKILLSKGVVNTFTQSPGLVHQILHSRKRHGMYLAVRMFDNDPSRSTDTFVGAYCTKEVEQGAAVLARLMNAQGVIFLLPKGNNVQIDNSLVKDFAVLGMEVDDNKYPSGFRENIIRMVKKHVKNTQTEYFGDIGINSLFVDSGTAYSVYEAVVLGKPAIETYVQVSGSCLKTSAMFRVKVGTTLGELARQCGGFKGNVARIIINGMFTGSMVNSLDVPVTKTVKSVTFLSAQELFNQNFVACIRCGKCRSVCPENLCPDLLASPVLFSVPVDNIFTESTALCSLCNLCNSVCPSRIPLSQIISLLKKA